MQDPVQSFQKHHGRGPVSSWSACAPSAPTPLTCCCVHVCEREKRVCVGEYGFVFMREVRAKILRYGYMYIRMYTYIHLIDVWI